MAEAHKSEVLVEIASRGGPLKHTISKILKGYEDGKVSRREVVQALALLAAGSGTASAAGFQVSAIDHVSIYVSDLRRSSEFYSRVFSCPVRPDQKAGVVQVLLGRGAITLRSGNPPGKVDHFAIGVDRYDKNLLSQDLKARGATLIDDAGSGLGQHIVDPDGFPVQFMPKDYQYSKG
jgi:catechol 2,3-dioxygenase-like lactoylglutathione lyase family enzyme